MLRMAVRVGSGLREMAAQINEQLYADLPGNRFITAWLGLIQADGTLSTYCVCRGSDQTEEAALNSESLHEQCS